MSSGRLRSGVRRLKNLVAEPAAAPQKVARTGEAILERRLRPIRARRSAGHLYLVRGKARPRTDRDQVIAISVMRNSEHLLDDFLEHHRSLGVDHFVLTDTGSTDSTMDIATSYPDVTLCRTDLPFRRYFVALKQMLVPRFGAGGWSLLVDMDELFDYPSSASVDLARLVAYLNLNGFTAVVAHMLDMFSDARVTDETPEPSGVKNAYRLYDATAVQRFDYPARFHNRLPADVPICTYYGGIRTEVFGGKLFRLTKHPLMFIGSGLRVTDDHQVSNASLADVSGVLRHYKFTSRFRRQIRDAMIHEQYVDRSLAYKFFDAKLRNDPDLKLASERSRELISADQLVDEGFLVASDRYRRWADGRIEAGARPPQPREE